MTCESVFDIYKHVIDIQKQIVFLLFTSSENDNIMVVHANVFKGYKTIKLKTVTNGKEMNVKHEQVISKQANYLRTQMHANK